MNEDLDELQRLLERATADKGASDDKLDPQTESLREAWIAFGRLLEAAETPLQRPPVPWAEKPKVRAISSGKLRRWHLSVAAVLAASLLLSVTTVWMLHGTNGQKTATSPPTQTTLANRQLTPPANAQSQAATTTGESQWDDSLDEQVSRFDQEVSSAREGRLFETDAFALMEDRIERVRQEVQADTL